MVEKIKTFLALLKESNFDLLKVYEQDATGVLYLLLLILVLVLIVVFFISSVFKTSSTVKLVKNIQGSSDIDEHDSKLTKLARELPKRGKKVALSLNDSKQEILNQELALLKDLSIKDKIAKYQQITAQYALLAQNSKKYKIDELSEFYEEKSKSLLDENLSDEIEKYYEEALFDTNDVENVNAIVSYAKTTAEPENILNPLKAQIDRNSYAYNLEFFKFIRALDEEKSAEIYEHCNQKLEEVFTTGEHTVSKEILEYMIETDEKENVYKYISSLENKTHLKTLYNTLFSKTEDIDLDLAFVANETDIQADYKTHIDNKLTQNWKDLGYIKHIIESKGVLETIGHIDYRNVLERVEKLQTQEDQNKAIAQALEIARKAQAIANEAKTLARSK